MCETPFHMLEFAFDFLQFSMNWAGGGFFSCSMKQNTMSATASIYSL